MTDWKYVAIDWSLEKRCTPCRMPPPLIGLGGTLSYKPVVCRSCKYLKVSNCSDCGEEMGFCTYHSDRPPFKDLDKKRKCNWYGNL